MGELKIKDMIGDLTNLNLNTSTNTPLYKGFV